MGMRVEGIREYNVWKVFRSLLGGVVVFFYFLFIENKFVFV